MRRVLTACCLVVVWLSSAAVTRAAEPRPDWVRVAETTAWQPRDSCGEAAFGGKLWLLGGWFNSFQDTPRDSWSSADGKDWTRVAAVAPWKHGDLPMTEVFQGKMWFLGGWHGGRLPGASSSAEVWSTADGEKWEQVTANAGWSSRISAGCAVFKDKLWITGGLERYYDGNEKSLKNDVWCTSDGKTWERMVENAPWKARAYHATLSHAGKLWVFGGGNYVPGYFALNDVWCSEDGKHWEQVVEHAPWPGRIWFSPLVYRDRMWLLGGWSNNPASNWNDVWHSADGKTWTELKTETVWAKRHEHSAYVFQDKMWVVAGHAQPLRNDVWSLELPKGWKGE